jgi:hypothetical protein
VVVVVAAGEEGGVWGAVALVSGCMVVAVSGSGGWAGGGFSVVGACSGVGGRLAVCSVVAVALGGGVWVVVCPGVGVASGRVWGAFSVGVSFPGGRLGVSTCSGAATVAGGVVCGAVSVVVAGPCVGMGMFGGVLVSAAVCPSVVCVACVGAWVAGSAGAGSRGPGAGSQGGGPSRPDLCQSLIALSWYIQIGSLNFFLGLVFLSGALAGFGFVWCFCSLNKVLRVLVCPFGGFLVVGFGSGCFESVVGFAVVGAGLVWEGLVSLRSHTSGLEGVVV